MGQIFACCYTDIAHPEPHEKNVEEPYRHQDTVRRILSFKDFKGFKKITDIGDHYLLGETLGKGSFGEVRKAEHLKGPVTCAVKIINKRDIEKH